MNYAAVFRSEQMKRKRKRGKKNRKIKARTKTILFVIGVFLCFGCIPLSILEVPLLVISYVATIGMILALPKVKENYDDYQNGEASGTELVLFLECCGAAIVGIIFCVCFTFLAIQDLLCAK